MSINIMDSDIDTNRVEKSLYDLQEIYRKHQDYIKTKYKISSLELEIIQFIVLEGNKKLKEVGQAFDIKLSTLTSMIDKIERQKLVQRVNSTEDRRVVYLAVTRKGHKLYQDYSQYIHIISDSVHQSMSKDQFGDFVDGLEKITKVVAGTLDE